MLKKIGVYIIAFAIILAVIVFPASAAHVDYNDLVDNIVTDGDNDLVTINIPAGYLNPQIIERETFKTVNSVYGDSISGDLIGGTPYQVAFYAFNNGNVHLSLTNIPDDTICSFTFYVRGSNYDGEDSYGYPRLFTDWIYYDETDAYLSRQHLTMVLVLSILICPLNYR